MDNYLLGFGWAIGGLGTKLAPGLGSKLTGLGQGIPGIAKETKGLPLDKVRNSWLTRGIESLFSGIRGGKFPSLMTRPQGGTFMYR